jgi:hypothetical protein
MGSKIATVVAFINVHSPSIGAVLTQSFLIAHYDTAVE